MELFDNSLGIKCAYNCTAQASKASYAHHKCTLSDVSSEVGKCSDSTTRTVHSGIVFETDTAMDVGTLGTTLIM